MPIFPVFGRKKGGSSLIQSFFINIKKITPTKAKEESAIIEQIKYSAKISNFTPDDVIANINKAGAPKLAE